MNLKNVKYQFLKYVMYDIIYFKFKLGYLWKI